MRIPQVLVSTLMALATTAAMSAVGLAAVPARTDAAAHMPETGAGARYIVQASTLGVANQDVARVGAKAAQNFAIIHAVSAYLNSRQVARLRKTAGVHIFE